MALEIKRTVSLKLKLSEEEEAELDFMMENNGRAIHHTLAYLQDQYEQWEKILESKQKEKQCYKCRDIMKLQWQHSDNGKQKMCNRCYLYIFSYFNTTRKDFLDELKQSFPEVGVHGGYFNGIAKYSPQMFKSYMAKLSDREKEVEQMETQLQACTDIIKQVKLRKKLMRKKRPLKSLEFRKNVIYLGSASMFDFKKNEAGQYWLGIRNPYRLKDKILIDGSEDKHKNVLSWKWYEITLGDHESYKTEHDKPKILEEAIRTQSHKAMFAKILKRNDYYELMFPKRDISHSIIDRKEVIEHYKKNKKVPVVCFSFGVKRPLTAVTLVRGKVLNVKTFGNANLWHYLNRERSYRARISKKLPRKNRSKWKLNKARKRFFRKRGLEERNRIKTETHALTKQVVKWLNENYAGTGCIIITRDTKGIKRISYPPVYRMVLDRWNLEQQKLFFSYKTLLRHFHPYTIPYSKSNILECPRCRKKQKKIDNKKETMKTLTVKLDQGMNKFSVIKQKINQVQEKKKALLKYPQTSENLKWLNDLGSKGTVFQKLLDVEREKRKVYNPRVFKCQYCKYSNGDSQVVDCLFLDNVFEDEVKNAKD